jgi:hypothetical protein
MATTQYVWTTDQAVTFPSMVSMPSNSALTSDAVDIRTQGYQSLQIQVRFKTGPITTPDTAQMVFQYRGSVDSEHYASRVTAGNQFTYTGFAATTAYVVVLNILNPSPFWKLLIANKTGANLSSDGTQFEVNYAGRATVTA